MKRHAIFVDAGYVFAQGSVSLLGKNSNRTQLQLDEAEFVRQVRFLALKQSDGVQLLRVYWYDGARNGPTVDHLALANMQDVKLRLGSINSVGEQKEVDSLLVTDLIDLARNQSICDATLGWELAQGKVIQSSMLPPNTALTDMSMNEIWALPGHPQIIVTGWSSCTGDDPMTSGGVYAAKCWGENIWQQLRPRLNFPAITTQRPTAEISAVKASGRRARPSEGRSRGGPRSEMVVTTIASADPVTSAKEIVDFQQLVRMELPVTGKSLNKEEFVTCGGLRLSEVSFKTMESRLCPGLYFAGELLDLDGITGGFNFQAAWTTGWIAGKAMAGP